MVFLTYPKKLGTHCKYELVEYLHHRDLFQGSKLLNTSLSIFYFPKENSMVLIYALQDTACKTAAVLCTLLLSPVFVAAVKCEMLLPLQLCVVPRWLGEAGSQAAADSTLRRAVQKGQWASGPEGGNFAAK